MSASPALPAIHADAGWSVDELVSTLSISAHEARLVEWWSVTADLPLDELLVELNLDDVERHSRVEVFGGETTDDEWPRSETGRPVLGIRLPTMLEPGQGHHFEVVGASWSTRSRHVCMPAVPVRRLEMRVHFDRAIAPSQVTRICGSSGLGPTDAAVNRIGDVALAVRDAVPGLLYGVAW